MSIDEAARQLIETRLLGWGVAAAPLFPGEHLGQDVEFADGDLAVVSGIDNLSQDLTLALTTALGTDPFNVNYGFDGVQRDGRRAERDDRQGTRTDQCHQATQQ